MSMGAMIVAALTMFPAEMVAISNGAVYGPFAGFLITWIGALIGASLGFGIARLVGRKPVSLVVGAKRLAKFDIWIEQYGVALLLLARTIPIIPFFVLNYGAGLINLRFSTYLVVTAIGIIPMSILCAVLGDRIIELNLAAINIVVIIAAVAIGVGFWFRRRLATQSKLTTQIELPNNITT